MKHDLPYFPTVKTSTAVSLSSGNMAGEIASTLAFKWRSPMLETSSSYKLPSITEGISEPPITELSDNAVLELADAKMNRTLRTFTEATGYRPL
jgi:hypothetical protein